MSFSAAIDNKMYFKLIIKDVVLYAEYSNGSGAPLSWSVENIENPSNRVVEVLSNGVIKVDDDYYVPINTSSTLIKNSLFAQTKLTVQGGINYNNDPSYTSYSTEIVDYIYALFVGYDVTISNASIISITAPQVTEGIAVILPNIEYPLFPVI